MLICPKCKSEYEEGSTVCSDCGSNLIQQPEVPEDITEEKMNLNIIPFIIGILIILCSAVISYKLTTMHFFSNGNGECNPEEFLWMLDAYHHSFLLIGIIICLPCIICWCKGKKRKC
jgi:uncharacterized membrane protein YvbJ